VRARSAQRTPHKAHAPLSAGHKACTRKLPHQIAGIYKQTKGGSKELLCINGVADAILPEGWTRVSCVALLGHHISSNLSSTESVAATLRSCWHACRRNQCMALKAIGLKAKGAVLNRAVTPVRIYSCPRWPWSKVIEDQLCKHQSNMLATLANIRLMANESWQDLTRRRWQLFEKMSVQPWSSAWRNCSAKGLRHCRRNRNSLPWMCLQLQKSQICSNERARTAGMLSVRPSSLGARAVPGQPVRSRASAPRHCVARPSKLWPDWVPC
jgi:hypothetical protein